MKASEIFLKYVEPMMDWVPKGTKAAELQKMLRVPEMVWNALVIREWGPDKNDHLKMLYEQLASAQSATDRKGMTALIDMWVSRKRTLFPEAKWAFDISVRDDGTGGHVVRAYIRIPDHLRHAIPAEWQKSENVRFVEFQPHSP